MTFIYTLLVKTDLLQYKKKTSLHLPIQASTWDFFTKMNVKTFFSYIKLNS